MMAGLADAPPVSRRWLRLLLVAGPAVFFAIGLGRLRDGGRLPGLPGGLRQAADCDDRDAGDAFDRSDAGAVGSRPAGTGAAAMSTATVYGLCGAVLVGLGLFGLIVHPQPLRKILAFNLIGGGVFLLFGVVARRGAAAGIRRRPSTASAGHHRPRRRFRGDGAGGGAAATAVSGDRAGDPAVEMASRDPDAELPQRRAGSSSFWRSYCPWRACFCRWRSAGGTRSVSRSTLMPAGLAVAVAIAAGVWRTDNVLQYFVGGWDPPLGVAFRADGLSAAMIVTAALLICGIGLFARAQFPTPAGGGNARAAGVLDLAAGGLGSAQCRLSSAAIFSTFMSLSSC